MPAAANIDSSVSSYSIQLNGSALADGFMVMAIQVQHQINRVPMAQVTIIESTDLANDTFSIDDSSFDPGKEIEILLGYDNRNETVFKGIIVKNSLRISGTQGSEIVLDCRHQLAKLTFTKKNKLYVDKKDSDVISGIVSGAGLSASVTATSTQHAQLHQHHATDWDFMMSRAEANGLYLFCEPTAIKIAKPTFGSPVVSLEYGVDIIAADLDLDARNQYDKVETFGWDIQTAAKLTGTSEEPTVNAQGSITGATLKQTMGALPYNQFAGGIRTQAELKDWSSSLLMRSRLSRIKGTVSCYGSSLPVVGALLEIKKISSKFTGEAYISGVTHHVSEGKWDTSIQIGLDHLPYYEEQNVTDLPAGGIFPAVNGLQVGVVIKLNEDPGGLDRVHIELPAVEGEAVKLWARLSTFYASNSFGAYFYPEVGDEIIVGFVNDDPQDAIILGSVYGKNKPPFAAAAENNTKALVTRTKLTIKFDEEKKVITIETPGKNSIVLDDDKKSITLTDANNNKVTLDDKGISMETPKDLKIKATGKVAIEGTGGVEIKSSADVKLAGLNVNAEAQVGAVVKGSATAELSASGQTTVKGAMVMIN